MHDLRLVAVTPERTHLVLEDDDNEQFRVPIDERLTAVMRHDHSRPGQLEIALDSPLTPRDIQARVRSGQSAQDVAAASGMPLARIERYAGPVLAEREHVAEQAKAAPSRRQSGGTRPHPRRPGRGPAARPARRRRLGRLGRLADRRGPLDGPPLLPRGRPRAGRAVGLRPTRAVLVPDNDEARWLVDEAQVERDETPARPHPPARDGAPGRRRPAADRELAGRGLRHRDDQPTATGPRAARRAREPQPARQAARAGRHPAVPSWDDIMFGTRRRD